MAHSYRFFDSLASGSTITLVDLNWHYDFKQRCGGLTKDELEYVINRQLERGIITIISNTEYQIAPTPDNHPVFKIDKSQPEKESVTIKTFANDSQLSPTPFFRLSELQGNE